MSRYPVGKSYSESWRVTYLYSGNDDVGDDSKAKMKSKKGEEGQGKEVEESDGKDHN